MPLTSAPSTSALLNELVERVVALNLGDGAVVWTYRTGSLGEIRPGISATTGGRIAQAPALLDCYSQVIGSLYRRHISRESLDHERVSTLASVRERSGEIGVLFDEEIHEPCGICDYIRSFLVVDDQVVGFVGSVRHGGAPFGAAEESCFERHVPELTQVMARLFEVERGLRHEALLVSTEGLLLQATRPALAMVDRLGDRELLGRAIAEHARLGVQSLEIGEVALDLRVLRGPMGTAVLARPRAVAPVHVSPLDLLTDRQRQVALRVAAGGPLGVIADDLGVRPATVRAHLKAIRPWRSAAALSSPSSPSTSTRPRAPAPHPTPFEG